MFRIHVGIDEAGRGPLAGPVAVGTCVFLHKNSGLTFRGVKDSKKLSHVQREMWFAVMKEEKKKGAIDFAVSLSSEKLIDKKGIVFAIRSALNLNLKKLKIHPKKSMIFLDGGLYAPKEFTNQKTIIRGDEKISVISCASIAAKVLRDKKMVMLGKKHPNYGFEIHKGYGTLRHRNAIKKFGASVVHRKSFLKSFDK